MLSATLVITTNDNGIAVYNKGSEVEIYKDNKYASEVDVGVRINLGIHGIDEEQARVALKRQWRFLTRSQSFSVSSNIEGLWFEI